MDPNANAAEQHEIVELLRDGHVTDKAEFINATERLYELHHALREWGERGGFAPVKPAPTAAELTALGMLL